MNKNKLITHAYTKLSIDKLRTAIADESALLRRAFKPGTITDDEMLKLRTIVSEEKLRDEFPDLNEAELSTYINKYIK